MIVCTLCNSCVIIEKSNYSRISMRSNHDFAFRVKFPN